MDYETRLEKNHRGFWEVRWTETDASGRGRKRGVSTRTQDKQFAEKIRGRLTTRGRLDVDRVTQNGLLPMSFVMFTTQRRCLEAVHGGSKSNG